MTNISSIMSNETAVETRDSRKKRFVYLIPIVLFVVMSIFLGIGLTLDPREVPSPLVGKPTPEFNLPPVKGRDLGLATSDLKHEVSLVNVFASWCVACRQEHPLLMRLSQSGSVNIHGLNYKDEPDDAAQWLDALGDPYTRTGSDLEGQVGIDWGVYGVPETFVVDHKGHIVYKHIGPIAQEDLDNKILPILEGLKKISGQQDG
jgi:cytochrome c biogenesis protein CcmG/thiol:disulfide interchange protein DsbE